jgi:hypothetical protein
LLKYLESNNGQLIVLVGFIASIVAAVAGATWFAASTILNATITMLRDQQRDTVEQLTAVNASHATEISVTNTCHAGELTEKDAMIENRDAQILSLTQRLEKITPFSTPIFQN